MKKLFLFVLISIFLATGISYAGPTVFRNGANVLADPVDGNGVGNRDYNDDRYFDEKLCISVKEENTSAISKGQVCAITGSSGSKIRVGLGDCDDATKIRVIGVASDAITQDGDGIVIYKGIIENVDTRDTNSDVNPGAEVWAAGDLLWVSTTAGGMTNVRPTSGRCIKAARTVKGNSNVDTLIIISHENAIWATAASGEDVVVRMGDGAGANKVSWRDYANNEVASLDSDGKFTVANDPSSGNDVGNRDYNDDRYDPTIYNDIGRPGEMDFGIGICPTATLALISGMTGMTGHNQQGHANHGNYQYSDGSIMCWLPRSYCKVGTGTNGLTVNLFDVKSIYDFPDTEVAITGMTRANPCVASVTAHGRSNGDYIWISHITEQAEWKSLSGKVYKVANKTDDTFELTDTSDVNIDTSGYAVAFVPATDPSAKTIYNEAMANGYAWFRADIDGGKIQAGQFVDKYMFSKNTKGTGYIASSIKNGLPISTAAAHNPIADLTACAGNYYFETINAAHARDGVDGAVNADSIFFEVSRFIQAKLAILSRAHGDASTSIANCAWYNATYNYPKGCNNNALRDQDDGTVLYTSDGYSNCGKTGSGVLFAKTTHNGQDSGIADVNGLMWEVNLGATCIAVTAAIEAITSAATPVFTWTAHGLSVGDYVMPSAITQADWVNFKDKIWKVATVPEALSQKARGMRPSRKRP
jgi:hypothetical protein